MHGDDVGAGWMVVMMLVMVLFWAAIILGIVWLVRGGSDGGWHWGGERKETPSEILERRFAEGAISVEDYHQRREVIADRARDDQAAGDT
jgi:putative membrane protein